MGNIYSFRNPLNPFLLSFESRKQNVLYNICKPTKELARDCPVVKYVGPEPDFECPGRI
jgi:hypothetical protein